MSQVQKAKWFLHIYTYNVLHEEKFQYQILVQLSTPARTDFTSQTPKNHICQPKDISLLQPTPPETH